MKAFIETKSATAPLEVEQKAMDFELKVIDGEKNVIEGYASTFGGEPDSHDDIVVKGAFAKTIQESGDRVKFLYIHDWNAIVGRVTELREDDIGLYFKAKISETDKGREVMQLVKDKVIDRVSIGYRTIKAEYDSDTGVRYLKEVRLFEISAVPFASNDNAIIMNAKNNPMYKEEKAGRVLSKQSEKAVRDAYEAMKAAMEPLESLLSAVEPADPEDDGKAKDFTDDEQKDILSMVEQMKTFAKTQEI